MVPEALATDRLELEDNTIAVHRFEGGECSHGAALDVPALRATPWSAC